MLRTPCFDWHTAHNGRMVNFAGWDMPVQYSTITEEHHAVRNAAGLFDIGHMGRIRFTGPDACRCLDHLVTNDVNKLRIGDIRYALITNEQGGILDDVLVYRFRDFHLLVVNASNRPKIVDWIERHRSSFDVTVEDLTFEYSMLAIQGPNAAEILNPLVEADVTQFRYYSGAETNVSGASAIVSRTGYTGENGFEVILSAEQAIGLWEKLIERGKPLGLCPCGLGCRDTLRLEAAMPLYGHELSESMNPFTAGLAFGVKLNAGEFIGRDALIACRENKLRPQRVGLILESRRIAREGTQLYSGDQAAGHVTSGTFSPTLEKSIAMAYVEPPFAEAGTRIEADIRGRRHAATVVQLPFYKRPQ